MLETTPVPVETHIPEKVAHKFCPCQQADGPAIAQALCGQVLPIEGRTPPKSRARCKDCIEIHGLITCPICNETLWG